MALKGKFDGKVMIEDELENNPGISRQALAALHEAAFGWALSLTRYDPQAAEDVMQQAYLSLVEGSARYDGAASLKTWLFAVIRNTARRHWRKQTQQAGLDASLRAELDAQISATESQSAEAQLIQAPPAELREAMRSLPNRQKQVLELVIDAEFTIEQVATVLGISVGSVRTHYHRAKQSLRMTLETDYESH